MYCPIILVFDPPTGRYPIPFNGGAKYTGWKNCYFRLKSPFISETVQDRPMVISVTVRDRPMDAMER